jgi:uncharacterized cupin superfamily protein
MIRSVDAAGLQLTHEPLSSECVVTPGVTTALNPLGESAGLEVGVWEHGAGVSVDTEVDEVFVVISGRGRVTCDQGGVIELAPGVVGFLTAGARTRWEITEPLRKVWITRADAATT